MADRYKTGLRISADIRNRISHCPDWGRNQTVRFQSGVGGKQPLPVNIEAIATLSALHLRTGMGILQHRKYGFKS